MNIDQVVKDKLSQHIARITAAAGEALGVVEDNFGNSAMADIVAAGVAAELLAVVFVGKDEEQQQGIWDHIRGHVEGRMQQLEAEYEEAKNDA